MPEDLASGVGLDDLPEVMHELFLQCVSDARSVAEPGGDFDGFVEELWRQTSAAFSLVPRAWPDGLPKPWPALVEEQRGAAEAVLEGRLQPGELPS
jgi:hypothetical protein